MERILLCKQCWEEGIKQAKGDVIAVQLACGAEERGGVLAKQ
jgi:hypothetical protein